MGREGSGQVARAVTRGIEAACSQSRRCWYQLCPAEPMQTPCERAALLAQELLAVRWLRGSPSRQAASAAAARACLPRLHGGLALTTSLFGSR